MRFMSLFGLNNCLLDLGKVSVTTFPVCWSHENWANFKQYCTSIAFCSIQASTYLPSMQQPNLIDAMSACQSPSLGDTKLVAVRPPPCKKKQSFEIHNIGHAGYNEFSNAGRIHKYRSSINQNFMRNHGNQIEHTMKIQMMHSSSMPHCQ